MNYLEKLEKVRNLEEFNDIYDDLGRLIDVFKDGILIVYCPKCQKSLPYIEDYFYLGGTIPNKQACKECERNRVAKQKRERYNKDVEYRKKERKQNNIWRKKNPRYFSEYMNLLNRKIRDKLGIGYGALHNRIRKQLERPEGCQICGIIGKNLSLHCINHDYTENLEQWQYLCRKCHNKENKKLRD